MTDESATTERQLEALTSLHSKTPSRKILKDTKLGHIINSFRKNKDYDEKVRDMASKTYRKWKVFIKNHENLQPIEVKSDKKTEEMRNKAQAHLTKVFVDHMVEDDLDDDLRNQLIENAELYAKSIEREVLKLHKRLISKPYRKHMQRICLQLRNDVTQGNIPRVFYILINILFIS